MTSIEAKKISFSYSKKKLINQIQLSIHSGKMISIVGPNGSGKSTLLKLLSGALELQSGNISVDKINLQTIKRKELAKKIAFLSQAPEAPADLTVQQLVYYGRYAYQSFFNFDKSTDQKFVDWALTVTGMSEFSEHFVNELSGGQRQRVWIAMALAQNSDCLFLDELTTYLDIRHQLEILNLLRKINLEQKKTIVMVHHDLNHALHYSDEMIVLDQGQIKAYQSIQDILANNILNETFQIQFKYFYDNNNQPVLFYENSIN